MTNIYDNYFEELAYILPIILKKYRSEFIKINELCARKEEDERVEYTYIDLSILEDVNCQWLLFDYIYDYTLETESNPFTDKELTEDYMDILECQRGSLKRLGHLRNDNLINNETITNIVMEKIPSNDYKVKAFINAARINGISQSQIENLDNIQKGVVLSKLSIEFDDFKLGKYHDFVTFCIVSYDIIKENIKLSAIFFNKLYQICHK